MADDLNDLGGIEIFEPAVNWRSDPKSDFDFARRLIEFEGTSHNLINLSDDKPERFEFLVSFSDKQEEFTFLSKWTQFKGRANRFWFINLQNNFEIDSLQAAGNTFIIVKDNLFSSLGYERLFILLTNGDRITHKITSSVRDEINEEITLNINNALDRNIFPTDVELMTLLHLCRFDSDDLELSYQNNEVSEINVALTELVEEAKTI